MKDTMERVISVLAKNIGYTVVLVAAIILFAVFSGGLISGIITAGSALVGYACIDMLAKEYKATTPSKKSASKSKKK